MRKNNCGISYPYFVILILLHFLLLKANTKNHQLNIKQLVTYAIFLWDFYRLKFVQLFVDSTVQWRWDLRHPFSSLLSKQSGKPSHCQSPGIHSPSLHIKFPGMLHSVVKLFPGRSWQSKEKRKLYLQTVYWKLYGWWKEQKQHSWRNCWETKTLNSLFSYQLILVTIFNNL